MSARVLRLAHRGADVGSSVRLFPRLSLHSLFRAWTASALAAGLMTVSLSPAAGANEPAPGSLDAAAGPASAGSVDGAEHADRWPADDDGDVAAIRLLGHGAIGGIFDIPLFGGGVSVEAGVEGRHVRAYAAFRYLRYESQHGLDVHHMAIGSTVLFPIDDWARLGFAVDLASFAIPRVTRSETMTTIGLATDLVAEIDLVSGAGGRLFADARAGAGLFFWGYRYGGSLGIGYAYPGG